MKTVIFLIGIIILIVILTVTSPVHFLFNIVLIAGITGLSVMYGKQKEKEKYDYESENPNALISGNDIAGTVYASYPNSVPGLGWIL